MATNFGHFTQASAGAPTLNGVAGPLINVIDWLLDVSNTNGRKVADKVYSGTNKAVYRFTTGQRFYLRVDDNYGQEARVRGYESMSDVDTGTDPFPLFTTYADTALVIRKSFEANANARDWEAVVWTRGFHLLVRGALTGTGNNELYSFGELIREDGVSDGWNTSLAPRIASGTGNSGTLSGTTNRISYGGSSGAFSSSQSSVNGNQCFARTEDGLTKAPIGRLGLLTNGTWSGLSYPTVPYINRGRCLPVDNRSATSATVAGSYRGYWPYLWCLGTQASDSALDPGTTHSDPVSSATFRLIKSTQPPLTNTASAGDCFLLETSDTDPLVP
jgi:hypothetical protein